MQQGEKMPIRSKPQQPTEAVISALIEKGGSVATHDEPHHAKTRNFQLRLNDEIRERIDRACEKRTVKPSWHAYIMEAILEKLKADERAE
jgi:hypothetical protein